MRQVQAALIVFTLPVVDLDVKAARGPGPTVIKGAIRGRIRLWGRQFARHGRQASLSLGIPGGFSPIVFSGTETQPRQSLRTHELYDVLGSVCRLEVVVGPSVQEDFRPGRSSISR